MHDDELSPATQAHLAALRFEDQELDRHLTKTSFIWRHWPWFQGISFLLMFGSIVVLMVSTNYYPISSPAGTRWFTGCMSACFAGLILFWITVLRSMTKGTGRAVLLAMLIFGFTALSILPALYAWDAFMNWLVSSH